jgi:hypothetical protein
MRDNLLRLNDAVNDRPTGAERVPAATAIPGLNSTGNDNWSAVRHDGEEIFCYSDRAGGRGGSDVWTATRDTVDSPWSTPVNLGAPVDTSSGEVHPYLAADRETLFFSSNRTGTSGGLDLCMTTRSKVHGGLSQGRTSVAFAGKRRHPTVLRTLTGKRHAARKPT